MQAGLGRSAIPRALPGGGAAKDPIGCARTVGLPLKNARRSTVKVAASLTSGGGDKQWLKMLVEQLSDEELEDLGLRRISASAPLKALPSPAMRVSTSLFSTPAPDFSVATPSVATSLALAATSIVTDDAADANFVENVTISTLLIEEPEQRFFYWRLRDSRLRQLLAETGSLGVVGSPSATTVLGSTAAMEAGQVYYLKPKKSRGLEPAAEDAARTLENAPKVLAALERAMDAAKAAAANGPSSEAATAAKEAEEDSHDETLWLSASDAVLARARLDFPDAAVVGSKLQVPGIKGEPPVEVDCAVVSGAAAWVVVSAETLTEQSGESVLEAVSNIAYWRDRDSCPAELQIFRGRRLVPVLCGKAVRPVHTEQTKVTPEILAECWAAVGVALIVPRSVSRRLGDAFQRKAASLFSKQA